VGRRSSASWTAAATRGRRQVVLVDEHRRSPRAVRTPACVHPDAERWMTAGSGPVDRPRGAASSRGDVRAARSVVCLDSTTDLRTSSVIRAERQRPSRSSAASAAPAVVRATRHTRAPDTRSAPKPQLATHYDVATQERAPWPAIVQDSAQELPCRAPVVWRGFTRCWRYSWWHVGGGSWRWWRGAPVVAAGGARGGLGGGVCARRALLDGPVRIRQPRTGGALRKPTPRFEIRSQPCLDT